MCLTGLETFLVAVPCSFICSFPDLMGQRSIQSQRARSVGWTSSAKTCWGLGPSKGGNI